MINHTNNRASGNAFLYILIAIALFAGLMLVLNRGQDSTEHSRLSQGQLQANAQRLLAYVNDASQNWRRMDESGTDLGEISLMLPTNGAFNNAPTIHKLFHPDGGGLLYRDMNEAPFRASAAAPVGWKFTLVNADWSATSGTDLIMTYVNIDGDICGKLNELIRNDATIPTVTVNYTNTFVNGGTALQESECAECKEYSSLCMVNGGVYAFYNALQLR